MKNILILTALLILSDRTTKFLAAKYMMISRNTGMAFGIPIPRIVLITTTVALLFAIVIFVKKEIDTKKHLAQTATAAILAGGIGNLGDRIYHGYVIDFINLPYWPSFNLADIYITLGILLMVIFYGKIKKAK